MWAASDRAAPEVGHLAVLRCLVGHDLGRRGFDERWEQAMTLAPPDSDAVEWTWARVRMLTERGSLAEAIEEDRRPVRADATTLGRQLFGTEFGRDLYVEGASNILNFPEFHDYETMRNFAQLVDEKEALGEVLSRGLDQEGLQVRIGSELPELKEFSVISAGYRVGGRPVGGTSGTRR